MSDDLSRRRGADDWGVAITDVDMTPRPRYRESRDAFEARMRGVRREAGALISEVRLENRASALRGSVGAWFTQCNCGWHGLTVADAELARREYDAHVCVAESVGQRAVDRAIACTDRSVLPKREVAVLQPSMPLEHVETPALPEHAVEDDAVARFALLEIK